MIPNEINVDTLLDGASIVFDVSATPTVTIRRSIQESPVNTNTPLGFFVTAMEEIYSRTDTIFTYGRKGADRDGRPLIEATILSGTQSPSHFVFDGVTRFVIQDSSNGMIPINGSLYVEDRERCATFRGVSVAGILMRHVLDTGLRVNFAASHISRIRG